jgi:hypothetical protein
MKTREWQNLFRRQTEQGKLLFTTTELANATGLPRNRVNVEMSRLVKSGVAVRYAKGFYGPADSALSLGQLVCGLDPHAYVTGAYALMRHGMITQVPALVTAFTTRRHFRRIVETPVGRIEFVSVRPPIYRGEVRALAGPELALCDFIYISLRRGMNPAALVTFRQMSILKRPLLDRIAKRYPATVLARIVSCLNPNALR